MAANDLTTLDNVKAWLNLTATADDDMLTRMITALSSYIQSWLNRQLASQSYTEVRDGAGKGTLTLANYPVTAVASLTVNGVAVPYATNSQGNGYLFDQYRIIMVGGGYTLTEGVQNIVVTYTAGYAAIPPEIEQACIELIATRYRERDRIGQTSKSIAGETVAFSIRDFPPSVQTILNNYKKVISL